VTGSDAAPAAAVERGSRNLLTRAVAALVLAPTAIAIAWAGGWFWSVLVTLATIGLYVEWLMVIGAARASRVVAAGIVALAVSGLCLALGRLELSLCVLAIGLAIVSLLSTASRGWVAAGFCYAATAEIASVLVRLDTAAGFVALIMVLLIVWVTDRRLFCRPWAWRTEVVAARQPQEDLGRRDRRIRRKPGDCRGVCGAWLWQNGSVAGARRGVVRRLAAWRSL
jgi:hypothetical protein